MVVNLRRMGAVVIGCDVVLAEVDRISGRGRHLHAIDPSDQHQAVDRLYGGNGLGAEIAVCRGVLARGQRAHDLWRHATAPGQQIGRVVSRKIIQNDGFGTAVLDDHEVAPGTDQLGPEQADSIG
jgi:hypothetical protein